MESVSRSGTPLFFCDHGPGVQDERFIQRYPSWMNVVRQKSIASLEKSRFGSYPSGQIILGGGFRYFYFHPYGWGRFPFWIILTNIFQMGWNHQLGLGANCNITQPIFSPKGSVWEGQMAPLFFEEKTRWLNPDFRLFFRYPWRSFQKIDVKEAGFAKMYLYVPLFGGFETSPVFVMFEGTYNITTPPEVLMN